MKTKKPSRKKQSNQPRIVLIDSTEDAKCELCGKIDDLRPYGPNGESVCFDCAMKDEEAAKRQFSKLLDSNDVVIVKT